MSSTDTAHRLGQLPQRWGANIRRERERAGMTRADLAYTVGVNKSTVSRWEAGSSIPTSAHQIRLCWALETPAARLFPIV
jgi:transcriptional regulator with XRE-family HTH domain